MAVSLGGSLQKLSDAAPTRILNFLPTEFFKLKQKWETASYCSLSTQKIFVTKYRCLYKLEKINYFNAGICILNVRMGAGPIVVGAAAASRFRVRHRYH
jgi:hypothetical protein